MSTSKGQGLRADAAEWRPTFAMGEAAAAGVDDEAAPYQPDVVEHHLGGGGSHWGGAQHQAATGSAYGYDEEDVVDEEDDWDENDPNMRWVADQARLVQEKFIQGREMSDPNGGGRDDYVPVRQPRVFAPPASTFPANAPQPWAPQSYGAMPVSHNDESMSLAPSCMTTATSIQVGVSAPKPNAADRRRHYAKEQAKAVRRETIAVKSGLEQFSNALLQSVSPFMDPLRRATGSSLPHIKVDQRYGARGKPHTAPAQFIVAPLVNYRPAHFHDLAPGNALEYHYDLAQVIKTLPSASCLSISYGAEWKPFTLPYAYLSCSDYAGEVKKLCPSETPNGKADSIADGDVTKDITALILSVPELEVFKKKSFVQALRTRANLYPMYAVFVQFFKDIPNYQIQIRDFHATPPQFLIRTSVSELANANGPIVISDHPSLWDLLPVVPNTFSTTLGRVAAITKAAAVAPVATPAAAATAPVVAALAAAAPPVASATQAPAALNVKDPERGAYDAQAAADDAIADAAAASQRLWLTAVVAVTLAAVAVLLATPRRPRS